jgi:glycosyltransferase involved in cell wall biosynthesis
MSDETLTSERKTARPFLTVVMRTQGTRPHTLVEALTCLAGQTDDDFEVLVLGHKLTLDRLIEVEKVIEDTPVWLRNRIRFVRVDEGNRTRPLNKGFELAHGDYIVALDDDDIPMAHWVETFRRLHEREPGRVLRSVVVRQEVVNVTTAGRLGVRAQGPPDLRYALNFDFIQHLRLNQSPNFSVAFPRRTFHDLNLRFDEDLTTTEDWDFLMRNAAIVGVANAPEITGIYRWWLQDESSRAAHPPEEWQRNYDLVLDKLDAINILLPQGSARRLLSLWDHDRLTRTGQPPDANRRSNGAGSDFELRDPWNAPQHFVFKAARRIYVALGRHPKLDRSLGRFAKWCWIRYKRVRGYW